VSDWTRDNKKPRVIGGVQSLGVDQINSHDNAPPGMGGCCRRGRGDHVHHVESDRRNTHAASI